MSQVHPNISTIKSIVIEGYLLLCYNKNKNMIRRRLQLFDTTLRDGLQSLRTTVDRKKCLALFKDIEKTGVGYIECGFPSSSNQEMNRVRELAKAADSVIPACLVRAKKEDIDIAKESMGTNGQLQILMVGSENHARNKRGWDNLDHVFTEIANAVDYARSVGFKDISAAFEDSSRASRSFLFDISHHAVAAGCETVVYADTVGCLVPTEVYDIVKSLKHSLPTGIQLSIHCHNDMGLATANALAACEAGVDVVHTTMAGIGERAGNTPLEEIAAILHYKHSNIDMGPIDLEAIVRACQTVHEIIGEKPWRHKPIIGENVFATAAGIHANGLRRHRDSYTYIDPVSFGRESDIWLNSSSGKSNLLYVLEKNGYGVDEDLLNYVFELFNNADDPVIYNDAKHLHELIQKARIQMKGR